MQPMLVGLLLFLAVMNRVWTMIIYFLTIHKVTICLTLGLTLLAALSFLGTKLWNWYAKRCQENSITDADGTSVFLGIDLDTGRDVHLKQAFRTMHGEGIGTTHAGKSESIVAPMTIQDIKNGSGVIIIDGKSEASFVNKIYAYAKLHGREKDFHLFSLANPGPSSSFNPLKGNSAQEVTGRKFFSS